MEAQYKSANGRIMVRVEGKNPKELFRVLADSQEVFDAERRCGCCKSEEIRFNVRSKDGNDYYKLMCADCGATFDFGQTKQGDRLFPKRTDRDGNQLPDNGWAKWGKKSNRNANEDVPF